MKLVGVHKIYRFIVVEVPARVKSRMEQTYQISKTQPVEVLTHLDLINFIARERGWELNESSYRAFKSHVKAWCTYRVTTLEATALTTLAQYQGPLNLLTQELSQGAEAAPDRAKNIRWAVLELSRVYESLRINFDLPSDYRTALQCAMTARGWTQRDLVVAIKAIHPNPSWSGTSVGIHLHGKSLPNAGKHGSKELVSLMEKALGLPVDTLARRAFKAPKIIKIGNPREITYRTHQSRRVKFVFSLKVLPASLEPFWKELTHWREKPAHLLGPRGGSETFVIPLGSRWTSLKTSNKYKSNVLRYLGWLCLPAPTVPLYELTEEERWASGLGRVAENLGLADIFDLDCLWEFFEFLRERQHNKEYTQDHLHYLIFLNSLVNHPYSFIKAHDSLAPVFGQTLKGAKWVAYVEEHLHQPILAMAKQLRKAVSNRESSSGAKRQRNPDEPLATIFADKSPMHYIYEMISMMEQNLAPSVHKQCHASQLRDIALFMMSMEVPLRAQNLTEITIGTDLTKDIETDLWNIFIPKSRLKNRSSPYAKDINRTYSKETSQAIDRYLLDGRSLITGNETPFFFLATSSGPKRIYREGVHPRQMLPAGIYWIVRSRTEHYFGTGVGSNLFRHILATSILKDAPGNVEVAAAVLNNSPDTIKANYKHITQQDGLRIATDWQVHQREAHTKRFGHDNG